MRPTLRRGAGTLAFLLLVSFQFLALPFLQGREIDNADLWFVLAMIPVGYLVSLVAENAVRSGALTTDRRRIRLTAVWVVGGLVVALIVNAMVSGGITVWSVLHAIAWIIAYLLFIFLLPKIVNGSPLQ
jgi:cell division protein FtsW (lipid II flippase)